MIEIVYNKEKENATGNEEFFCVPRNIRQMGDVPKDTKIYMEDYVHTYLTADWKEEETKGKIAILLGKYNWKSGIAYVFVKSAVSVEGITVYRDNYPLTEEVWGNIYEEMKKYFPGQEVVGWYLSLPDNGMRITDGMVQTHLKHFGENDKVLLLADPGERECAFYLYKNNRMERQKGYYVFYEKNDLMQEYMLMKNPDTQTDYSGKVQDRAVKDFRKIAARKLEEHSGKGINFSWIQVACTGVVVMALAAGTIWLRSQQETDGQMDQVNSEEASFSIEASDEDYNMENTAEDDQEMVLLTPEVSVAPEGTENDSSEGDLAETPVAGNEESSIEETPEENAEETAISVYTKYTVREGDTISRISMRYYGNLSKITEICKINNMLEEDVIYPGQTILLP